MLFEILNHIKNIFPDSDNAMTGTFKVEDGTISPSSFLADGQYFLIEGSTFNDGVYKKGDTAELTDEVFEGIITPLRIPREFLTLVKDIEAYQAVDKPSAYTSESFGGYSYTKGTTASGNAQSWKNAFGSRLNTWRKI